MRSGTSQAAWLKLHHHLDLNVIHAHNTRVVFKTVFLQMGNSNFKFLPSQSVMMISDGQWWSSGDRIIPMEWCRSEKRYWCWLIKMPHIARYGQWSFGPLMDVRRSEFNRPSIQELPAIQKILIPNEWTSNVERRSSGPLAIVNIFVEDW